VGFDGAEEYTKGVSVSAGTEIATEECLVAEKIGDQRDQIDAF